MKTIVYVLSLVALIPMSVVAADISTAPADAEKQGVKKRDLILYKHNGGVLKRPDTQKAAAPQVLPTGGVHIPVCVPCFSWSVPLAYNMPIVMSGYTLVTD